MKIDFDHFRGSQLADEMASNLQEERELTIINRLRPTLGRDGHQWIWMLGEMPTNYLAGWGDTPSTAMTDFVRNFYKQRADTPASPEGGGGKE